MPKGEVICFHCGQYESECRCGEETKPDKDKLLSDEAIAKAKGNEECIDIVREWGECGECSGSCPSIAKAQLAKDEARCEACADGFISTHEKATNDIRKLLETRHRKVIEEIVKDLEIFLPLVMKYRKRTSMEWLETYVSILKDKYLKAIK